MDVFQAAINAAIEEIEKARAYLSRISGRQVTSVTDRDYLQAVAYSWFRSHRSVVASHQSHADLSAVDAQYQAILDATAKRAARSTYIDASRLAKNELIAIRSLLLVQQPQPRDSDNASPDFAPLAHDRVMQGILLRRWTECQLCLEANAHLAATVMMGGLLEALFIARANKLTDRAALVRASSAPIDPKTKKVLDLRDWTLRPYIDVGHELGWITRSGKDVAAILRDYRNYIHPEKERLHDVSLGHADTRMFWEVTKALARQLLTSATAAGTA